eukprot:5059955-Prymnesium_polylepis.2
MRAQSHVGRPAVRPQPRPAAQQREESRAEHAARAVAAQAALIAAQQRRGHGSESGMLRVVAAVDEQAQVAPTCGRCARGSRVVTSRVRQGAAAESGQPARGCRLS